MSESGECSTTDSEERKLIGLSERRVVKPRTTGKIKKESISDEEHESDDYESDEIENDRESDEDFSLIVKRKKKKKKKKEIVKEVTEKRVKRVKKEKQFVPKFEDVLRAQIEHAQRFVNYEDSDTEEDDQNLQDSNEEQDDEIEERPPTPPPVYQPPPPKKRKVTIYPWRPIGITGGRFPVNDVSKLNDINPYDDN